jgi:hypothetical protein
VISVVRTRGDDPSTACLDPQVCRIHPLPPLADSPRTPIKQSNTPRASVLGLQLVVAQVVYSPC